MLPPGGRCAQRGEKGQSKPARQAGIEGKRPVVRASLPEVAGEERLLRRRLPDAHLTIAQEAGRKARHGRYEVRTLWTLSSADINAYAGSAGTVGKPWPGLAQVSRIQRVICQRGRKTGNWELSEEVAYSITSLSAERAGAGDILRRWRVHWRIEALHWVRDVTFGEDESQIYTGQVPEAFSILRNAAVTLVGLAAFPSIAAGVRELQTRPLGVLGLFARLASRMKAGQGSIHSPARQSRPPSQVQATGQPSSPIAYRARDPA